MTNFCPTIKPGENRLAECLSNQLDMELKGNAESTSSGEQLIEAVHAGRKNQQIRLQGKPGQEGYRLNDTQTAWLAVAQRIHL